MVQVGIYSLQLRLSPAEQVDESSRYLGHFLEHCLACRSILLELELLKSQKYVFNEGNGSVQS